MSARMPIGDRVSRTLRRAWKMAARRATALVSGPRQLPNVVFVLGSGRSGTRVPLVALERAPETITYTEGHSRVFRGTLLKGDDVVHDLLRTTPFRTVVLKPICESHRALEFLQRFPNARVIWIFRDYRDAVNSAAKKWTSALRHVRNLAAGDLRRAGWRAGGLTQEKLALVRDWCTPDLTVTGAHGIMWYLRNSLFFELGLDGRPDVLLVRYEDLVREPETLFPPLFAFAGSTFEPRFVAHIHDQSVGRHAPPALPERVERACVEVHAHLLNAYRARQALQAAG